MAVYEDIGRHVAVAFADPDPVVVADAEPDEEEVIAEQ